MIWFSMTYSAWDKDAPYDDVNVIDIPFPEKKYIKLLKLCKLKDDSDLSDEQISMILVNAVYSWLKGTWSLDDLASIGNKFWFGRKKEQEFDELGDALYAADEAGYYIRRIYVPGNKDKIDSFSRWIITIMKYYEKYRSMVIKEK